MSVLGWLFLLILTWVYGAFANTVVLSSLWQWFVVPAFGWVAPAPLLLVGLSALLAYCTARGNAQWKGHEHNSALEVAYILVHPWVTLFFGWLLHLWIEAHP